MSIRPAPGTKFSDEFSNKIDYYSSSQVTVWFGNIFVDDINSIQWSRAQSKRPIYGYASQQFDAVAKGTVIIQGNFTINFRQSGYLQAVFDNIKYLYEYFRPDDPEAKAPYNSESWDVVRGLIGVHLKNGTFGPQSAEEIIALGNTPDFVERAKIYENVIWGSPELVGKDDRIMKNAADVAQSNIIPDGFNILITYGNLLGNDAQTINDQIRSTSKSLVNVHMIGESQVIQVGGQPVMEQYDFIARGTDENLGTSR